MTDVIVDVRERDEFALERVDHSVNVPLSVFTSVAPGVLTQLKDRRIVFMCRGGARASQALELAKQMGFNDVHVYSVYPGGIQQWKKSGLPVASAQSMGLPLQRQVQLAIGVLIVVLGVMGYLFNPAFALVAAAVGLGLLVAGATGYCMLANIMAKAPWNKARALPGGNACVNCG
ncbi:MAG: rhodanese-like domain-containing protein [Gammaproteobacteria bacterium]|nr:rhodanese-like domain-containing protein [Gammaproteobacteria bacterium]